MASVAFAVWFFFFGVGAAYNVGYAVNAPAVQEQQK
jgi:hypothetical protein